MKNLFLRLFPVFCKEHVCEERMIIDSCGGIVIEVCIKCGVEK